MSAFLTLADYIAVDALLSQHHSLTDLYECASILPMVPSPTLYPHVSSLIAHYDYCDHTIPFFLDWMRNVFMYRSSIKLCVVAAEPIRDTSHQHLHVFFSFREPIPYFSGDFTFSPPNPMFHVFVPSYTPTLEHTGPDPTHDALAIATNQRFQVITYGLCDNFMNSMEGEHRTVIDVEDE